MNTAFGLRGPLYATFPDLDNRKQTVNADVFHWKYSSLVCIKKTRINGITNDINRKLTIKDMHIYFEMKYEEKNDAPCYGKEYPEVFVHINDD